MQAVTEGDVRIYVVFPAQEYEGLAEMALGEQRDLRDQVRACVRAEAGLAFGSNGHGAGEKGVILINGHGSETHGNGHRTALAGTGKGTRQG